MLTLLILILIELELAQAYLKTILKLFLNSDRQLTQSSITLGINPAYYEGKDFNSETMLDWEDLPL